MGEPGGEDSSKTWATEYYQQQALLRKSQGWKVLLKPSFLGACLAVAGRVLIGPMALLLLFTATGYMSDATVLIKADSSFLAYTQNDLSMAGGCTGCLGPCKIVLLKYFLFNQAPLTTARPSPPSFYKARMHRFTGTAQEVMDVVKILNLSVAPQMVRELELGIAQANECPTTWNMIAISRLFQYPTAPGDPAFAKIPAVDLYLFPDYTECRPLVANDDSLVGSKLALATNGEDLLSAVPEILTLFPYSFASSLAPVPREFPASNTQYDASTVVQPLLRAYYGGCRVRAVNTTGVYIEDQCAVEDHWEIYGLMVHSPDDVPLCSTGDVCIHNYFNSLWEWVNYMTADQPDRIGMNLNTFRSRYADVVSISVLPGIVVTQMLLMGVISLYQVMSHKRSVLLTQIWAYRCQNGRMQVVYLAQISYHLIYNSDLYLLGLATGTLTGESIANLTCCFFAFSYSFVNLLKARSGDQQLDRHFRLTWETMQLVITICVGSILLSIQRTPLVSILSNNSEILRKTSARGAQYCGLNDSCILFTHNMPSVVTLVSVVLGAVALVTSFIVKKLSSKVASAVRSARMSLTGNYSVKDSGDGKVAALDAGSMTQGPARDHLTSFERNCLGGPFKKLFRDCDDMAYVMYNGKRCTTVEALLLTGYLYYGEHIYQASAVMLLLLARVIPRKVLRTFNMLLLRWHVDPTEGTLSHVLSCTWYAASEENVELSGATPLA